MSTLIVATSFQKEVLEKILIPEIKNGFWKRMRPNDKTSHWDSLSIEVGFELGLTDFELTRSYNFCNADFFKKFQDKIMALAKVSIGPSVKTSVVKKQLLMITQIMGGRLTEIGGEVTKLKRGGKSNKPKVEKFKPKVVRAAAIYIEPSRVEELFGC